MKKLKADDLTGQVETIDMMGLRSSPGMMIDQVSRGKTIRVEKHGKLVAIISPPPTIIYSDGTWEGERPLTKPPRRVEGGK